MELTNEQIANLTPEQITELDENPEAVEKYLADQEKATEESEDESEQEEESSDEEGAANGAGRAKMQLGAG